MSRARGNIAEERACEHLRRKGFEIIDRNVNSRFGEIDVVALKGEVLHFVEVKSGSVYESAIQNITPTKLQRILRTAEVYMKKHHLSLAFCIDAVIVTPEAIETVENITL